MNAASKALATSWLAKAESDLQVARLLIGGQEPHLDAGMYHSQQAAEKSLKALSAFLEQPFPKTHNLRILLEIVEPLHPEIMRLSSHCDLLTPYATEFRYPGEVVAPDLQEGKVALVSAEDVFACCKKAVQEDQR